MNSAEPSRIPPIRGDSNPPVTAARSRNMRAVRRKDTAPELHLRKLLWSAGLRYRKQLRLVGTTPDLVFVRARVAIFVDGCFWHGCPAHYRPPRTRTEYWTGRIERNISRDARDTLRLQQAGYTVIRVWACQLRSDPAGVLLEIRNAVSQA